MYCKNCGNEILRDSSFCPKCGFALQENGENQQTARASSNYKNDNINFSGVSDEYHDTCSICGTPVPEGYKFCPECSERTRKKNSGSLSKMVVILSVAIAIIAISLTTLVILKETDIIFYSDNQISDSSDETDENDVEEDNETAGEDDNKDEDKEEKVKPEKTYQVYETYYPITWTNAKTIAENIGGHIAVASSKEEFEKMCAVADAKGLVVFWMGVKRTGDDWSEVTCLDGSTNLPYAKWLVTKNSSEPSLVYNGVEERYLMALKSNGKWYFNDAPNDISADYPAENYRNKISFIIEKDE